jgi:hypothetical protein
MRYSTLFWSTIKIYLMSTEQIMDLSRIFAGAMKM